MDSLLPPINGALSSRRQETGIFPYTKDSQFDREVLALQTHDFYHPTMPSFLNGLPPERSRIRPAPKPVDRLYLGATADRAVAVQAYWWQGAYQSDLVLHGPHSGIALMGIASGEMFLNHTKPERRMTVFTFDSRPWDLVAQSYKSDSHAVLVADMGHGGDYDRKIQYLAQLLGAAHPQGTELAADGGSTPVILVIDQLDEIIRKYRFVQDILVRWQPDTRGMTMLLAGARQRFPAMSCPSLHVATEVADPMIFATSMSDGQYMPFRVYPPFDLGLPALPQ